MVTPRLIITLLALSLPGFGAGTVSGVLRDSVTGQVVQGARVNLYPPGTVRVSAVSDEGGHFRLEGVSPGTYYLTVHQRGYAPVGWHPEHVPVVVKDGVETKLERMIAPGASIEGRLISEEGVPFPNVWVSVSSEDRSQTDKDGRFRLDDLEADHHFLEATLSQESRQATLKMQGGELRGYPASTFYPEGDNLKSATSLVLTPGARKTGVEFRLRRFALVSLSGNVVDGRTGQPPGEGAEIELAATNNYTIRVPREPLANGGSFHFGMLRPGEYQVTVYRSARFDARPIHSTVVIGDRGLTGHRVILPVGTGRIEARFQRPPPAGLQLRLSPPTNVGGSVEGRSAQNGSILFNHVPPGKWRVSVSQIGKGISEPDLDRAFPRMVIRQAGREIVSWRDNVEVFEGENQPIEIEFRDRFVITGNVIGTAGRPIPDQLAVYLTSGTTKMWVFARKDGTFRTEVDPGEYTVSAWPRDRMNGAGECGNARKIRVTENISGLRLVVCP